MEKSKLPRSSARVAKKKPSRCKSKCLNALKKRWAAQTNDSNNVIGTKSTKSDGNISASYLLTASERKVEYFRNVNVPPPDKSNCSSDFLLLHKSVLSELYSTQSCSECDQKCLTVEIIREIAFAAELKVHCRSCDACIIKTFTSPKVENSQQYEVNRRISEAFLSIGKGSTSMDKWAMTMGMNTMDRKTFSKYVRRFATDSSPTKAETLIRAREIVRETHEDLNPALKGEDIIDIGVSYDGTWHKRGHTSLYGIGFVIDILTGLVIDYEILSKFCPECNANESSLGKHSKRYTEWHTKHVEAGSCEKNFNGSSGSMEMEIAGILWKRSIEMCNMKYTSILSDGDSKTFIHLQKGNVYGSDVVLEKEECLNHVAKRLGTALRNCVKEWRVKGITLGGKKRGNLKEETITKLTNYYRKAIKDNVPSLECMKTAVFASLHHCMSNDKKSNHSKCPGGINSWCFFNRALARGEAPASHTEMKTVLDENVVAKILPIYQRLASDELLMRCCRGKTQNCNESLHSSVWSKCPKEIFVSKKRLNLAVIAAIAEFNMGLVSSLLVKQKDNQVVSNNSIKIAHKKDKERIAQSKKRSVKRATLAKLKIKKIKASAEAAKLKAEGMSYGAGQF